MPAFMRAFLPRAYRSGQESRCRGRRGATVYPRSLVYRNKIVRLPDGTEHSHLSGEEKGTDVHVAIDVIGLAWQSAYDVALVFSQDQDLSEVARKIRDIARSQGRGIKIAGAFPVSPVTPNRKGINWTDWIRIDRATYSVAAGGSPIQLLIDASPTGAGGADPARKALH